MTFQSFSEAVKTPSFTGDLKHRREGGKERGRGKREKERRRNRRGMKKAGGNQKCSIYPECGI